MRFGSNISASASRLTLVQHQDIVGIARDYEAELILICFDDDTVGEVPGRFASIAAEELEADQLAEYPVKVIGARKASGANAFPKAITCYNPFYKKPSARSSKPERLFKAVASAQAELKQAGSCALPADILWESVCELLRRCNIKIDDRQATKRNLRRFLEHGSRERLASFKGLLKALLDLDLTDRVEAENTAASLLTLIEEVFEIEATAGAREFCEYDAAECTADARSNLQGCFLTIATAAGDVTLAFDTIHNVKGETHAATLILECHSNGTFDLKEVLPALIDRQQPARARMVSVKRSSQLVFVGMTRPKHLLGFAVLKSHVADHLEAFREAGWKVVDLTVA